MTKSISKSNPNILLKLYSREREQMGYDEYERACKVYKIGVSFSTDFLCSLKQVSA